MTHPREPALSTTRDRIAGALLGVHAGDSLGATLEFMTFDQVRAQYPDGLREIVGGGLFDWPAGHATDDTDLTRAVLLAYLSGEHDVVAAAGQRMLAWLDGHWPGRAPGDHPVDVGGATAKGLERFRSSGDWRQAGAGAGSAGNGSLMRCLPTALARARATPAERFQEAAAISAITHDDPRCVHACVAYTEIVVALLAGESPREAARAGLLAMQVARFGSPPEDGAAAVELAIGQGLDIDLVRAAATGDAGLAHGGTGYVLDSLALAVAALVDPRPAVDSLVDVTRLGGDTDTNGAIAGGLLGARDGTAAWPATWVSKLQFAAEFEEAADALVN
ncbi:ADP-ribosylglycohydrolase family protein [Kineosporia succinea]|uniref:ADP-ribosylglycohydrolase n=1 Tax=Kineosporia succinea TaxID=84632 RepID=A0ABT9P2C0_9ACTN|nr:ADP-ribosylglycohydrolase family protein [Kineosporia succinea]MDP9826828.1 ADP-ribosylglycohydrolase [Kineosporia succinea]